MLIISVILILIFAEGSGAEGIPEMTGTDHILRRDVFGTAGTFWKTGTDHRIHDCIGQPSPVFYPDISAGIVPRVTPGFLPPLNVILSFTLSDTVWDAESLGYGGVAFMAIDDSIKATNIGNIPLDWALWIRSADSWTWGVTPAGDRFSLKSRFTLAVVPPGASEYHALDDDVPGIMRWATATIFGPEGWNVPPGGVNWQYVWFKLMAPLTSSTGRVEQIINIGIICRAHMP